GGRFFGPHTFRLEVERNKLLLAQVDHTGERNVASQIAFGGADRRVQAGEWLRRQGEKASCPGRPLAAAPAPPRTAPPPAAAPRHAPHLPTGLPRPRPRAASAATTARPGVRPRVARSQPRGAPGSAC